MAYYRKYGRHGVTGVPVRSGLSGLMEIISIIQKNCPKVNIKKKMSVCVCERQIPTLILPKEMSGKTVK